MDLEKAKLAIYERFIAHAASDGATFKLLQKACVDLGYSEAYAQILFPGKIADVLSMLLITQFDAYTKSLDQDSLAGMRVKDKIKKLLTEFLKELNSYKAPLRAIIKGCGKDFGLLLTSLKISWEIVDEIWYLAGDKSLDFNYYTKRALLFSVFVPSLVYWLDQNRSDHEVMRFVDGLLIRVNKIGKVKAYLKQKILGRVC